MEELSTGDTKRSFQSYGNGCWKLQRHLRTGPLDVLQHSISLHEGGVPELLSDFRTEALKEDARS